MGRPCSQQVRREFLQLAGLQAKVYRQGKIDEQFKPPYDKLYDIRNQLEKISLTQAWSLRETDLYSYQRQLDRIDESRVNGNFIDPEGNPADLHTQRVRHLCWGLKCWLIGADTAISAAPKLCLHLRPHDLFGASIRGTSTGVQPTSNTAKVLAGGSEIRRCLVTT